MQCHAIVLDTTGRTYIHPCDGVRYTPVAVVLVIQSRRWHGPTMDLSPTAMLAESTSCVHLCLWYIFSGTDYNASPSCYDCCGLGDQILSATASPQ